MLHKPSEDRITGVRVEDKVPMEEMLLHWFKDAARACHDLDLPAMDTTVMFWEDGDEFVEGTYVPEIHLTVRRVEADADGS